MDSDSDSSSPRSSVMESPDQIWQDALNFMLKARILTGRAEFDTEGKEKMILSPSNDDVCSLEHETMMGKILDALKGGAYAKGAEGALEDIIIPIRFAVRCSHKSGNKFTSFFSSLFSKHKNDSQSYMYSLVNQVVMLLSFHYATLAFNVPGITVSLLTKFEASVLSGSGLQGSINLLPSQLQRTIKASLQIPSDDLNVDILSKYFGGGVPFLLIFRDDAMDKAMNIAATNGASVISSQGSNRTGTMQVYTSPSTASNGGDGPLRRIVLTEGTAEDAAREFRDMGLSSGRVAGDDSDEDSS